jgi:hypothetical protein
MLLTATDQPRHRPGLFLCLGGLRSQRPSNDAFFDHLGSYSSADGPLEGEMLRRDACRLKSADRKFAASQTGAVDPKGKLEVRGLCF